MTSLWIRICRSRARHAVAAGIAVLAGCSSGNDDSQALQPAKKPAAVASKSKSPSKAPSAAQIDPAKGGGAAGTGATPPDESIDASGRIVEACQGMKLLGMKYSPGGTTLPNKCVPFDVRNNNPYAVRCIDAMPDFHTPFPGDEYCVLPPPPDLGFQVGVHPGGNIGYWEKMWAGDYSFYEDAAVTGPYVVEAGGETLQNYLADFDGPSEERYYYRRYFRGRYGSHHGTSNFMGKRVTEGWQDSSDVLAVHGGADLITVQNAYTDVPQRTLEPSPEEEGIGIKLTPNSGVGFNLHHFNSTSAPLLRENWINAWYIPKEQVTRQASQVYVDTPIDYPIGMELDNEGMVAARGETHVLSLWGHRHAWTTRFHAWVVRMDGSQELIYDSNDWFDMPTFSYNSAAQNPEPGKGMDGASSGPLILQPGDELHFSCHVETTQARADKLGVPLPTEPLQWMNQAFAGEMCLLMGQTTGSPLFGSFSNFHGN